MTDPLLTEIEDRVLTITFNRPEKKNAITQAMYGAAAAAINDANTNAGVRAIIITGTGNAFTAGNDLLDFQAQSGGRQDGDMPVHQFLRSLITAEKPLVAAVNGFGVGVGFTLLLHCDFVYMAEEAWISAPFVDLALVPEAASSKLLPARVGQLRAAEIVMLGKRVTAAEALEMGLATSVVAAGDLMNTAQKTALQLASKAPASLAQTKALLRGDKDELFAQMALENVCFGKQLQSPEVAEAITAFLEKRAPVFA